MHNNMRNPMEVQ